MVLGILLIIFALVAHQKPTFAVGLILALLPTYLIRYEFQGIPTTFLELLVLVFLAITFLTNLNHLGQLKQFKTINWMVVAFLAAGAISVLVSPEKAKALGEFKAFILEPTLFFYAVRLVIKKPNDLKPPLNLLFLSAVIISIFGIIQYFTLWNLPMRFWGTGVEVERITSFFDYPNALALYLAPLATFFFAMLLASDKVVNGKNLAVGLIIILFALMLTFSRGAWLAVTFTALLLLLIRYPWKQVFGIGAIALLIFVAVPQTRDRISLILHDPSSTAHSKLMSAAVNKIIQNPLFGNGLYGFRTTLAQQNFQGEILNYPHNIFLNFWVEMGILGLLSFLGIIIVTLKEYRISPNWYRFAASAFLVAVVVHGLVDVPYFKNDLSVLFWFMVSVFYIK